MQSRPGHGAKSHTSRQPDRHETAPLPEVQGRFPDEENSTRILETGSVGLPESGHSQQRFVDELVAMNVAASGKGRASIQCSGPKAIEEINIHGLCHIPNDNSVGSHFSVLRRRLFFVSVHLSTPSLFCPKAATLSAFFFRRRAVIGWQNPRVTLTFSHPGTSSNHSYPPHIQRVFDSRPRSSPVSPHVWLACRPF